MRERWRRGARGRSGDGGTGRQDRRRKSLEERKKNENIGERRRGIREKGEK